MRNVAIIENGIVSNVIVVANGSDGDREIELRNGIEITNTGVEIGWGYDGNSFIEPMLTPEQLQDLAAIEERQQKIDSAKAKLATLGLDEAEIDAILAI